ncbi:MAG: hypothetical protein LBO06_08375 [Bacteroidales bacterium]|nr:hypothetical protein [Bacteroidales bacterium]
MKKAIILGLTALLFAACGKDTIESFSIDFPTQSDEKSDTISMTMDLTDAVTEGIIIPTKQQTDDGFFHFNATITKAEKMYYKIYYQNESYKFANGDSLDNENFYGSWETTEDGFKPVPTGGKIEDKFRIVGNPRNEKIYYGADPTYENPQKRIENCIAEIKKDKKWFNYVKKVSAEKKVSIDEQLFMDACWVVNLRQEGETNNRYKRNPRMGVYSFLLVVVNEEALAKIPKQISNIALSDSVNGFINPYTYFLCGEGKKIKGINSSVAKTFLKVKAVLNGDNGVYVDMLAYARSNFSIYPNNPKVGNNDTIYYRAVYQQYFHNIAQDYFLKNIPLVEDVIGDNYDTNKYKHALKEYASSSKRIIDHPQITDYPAKTIKVCDKGYISLINPGNANRLHNPKKESVGIKTRIGFTYGKFRGKIKFPAQLNKSGVWSGLTNAFWLIYQSEQGWNKRRICSDKGYVTYEKNGSADVNREKTTNYSEIDIEIIKTNKYWGGGYDPIPADYNPYKTDECILACTNWDLACPTPAKFFNGGSHQYKYLTKDFTYVRWYDTYRALTSRETISNNIFNNEYYYYEIEWKPNEIIWRIGESLDKMYVVGYMSDKFTVIPNNQMLAVMTQE